MTADTVGPVYIIVVSVHVKVDLDGFHDAGASDMKGFRLGFGFLFVQVLRLQYSFFKLLVVLDEIGVFSGGTGNMVIPVQEDVTPKSLEGETVLSSANRADVRHEAPDKRNDVESGQCHGTREEEIALRAVLAAFVPVTPSVSAWVAENKVPRSTDMLGVNLR